MRRNKATTDNIATIPVAKLTEARKVLTRLVKKAAKYGNDDIEYSVGQPYMKKMDVYSAHSTKKVNVRVVDITITGNAPIYNGWELKARVELLGKENLIHQNPQSKGNVEDRFRTIDNVCEHCNTKRRRKDVFVFENDFGQQKAVGRTCLHDFMGLDNPMTIVSRMRFFDEFEEKMRDIGQNYAAMIYNPNEVLIKAAAFIRTNGWISGAYARNSNNPNIISTASLVMVNINKPVDITENDIKLADDTIRFFDRDEMFDNDYMNNIRVLIRNGGIEIKHFPLLVSAINACQKQVTYEEKKKAEAKNGEFIGEVGQRMREVAVTCTKAMFLRTDQYGDKYMYIFTTEFGNTLVWFSGLRELSVDEKYKIDFSIKDHRDSDYGKQTIITRAKVKEMI